MLTARRPILLRIFDRKTPFRLACLLACTLASGMAPAHGQKVSKEARAKVSETLSAADAERWTDAAALAKQQSDPIVAKIVEWMRLGTANSGATFDEIETFLAANPGWPNADRLRRRAEEAMGPALPDERILAWFARSQPASPDGAFHLARGLEARSRTEEAATVVRRAWAEMDMGDGQADDFRRRFQKYIRQQDDIARLERMLW